ncbi:hypothetical protein B0H13DRAFT_1882824 [Mycena leptocephala]|nr:hypothetical protein B0H13DRAFT_1882824 [Mycena leptocephala]
MSLIQPTTGPGDITHTPYFRGCIMKPDSLQLTCRTQRGSTATKINGTLGCPYNTGLPESDGSKKSWLSCCGTTNCLSELCTEGGLDAPYPSSSSASASDSGADPAPSATSKPNSGPSVLRSREAAFVGLFVAEIVVRVLASSL